MMSLVQLVKYKENESMYSVVSFKRLSLFS